MFSKNVEIAFLTDELMTVAKTLDDLRAGQDNWQALLDQGKDVTNQMTQERDDAVQARQQVTPAPMTDRIWFHACPKDAARAGA